MMLKYPGVHGWAALACLGSWLEKQDLQGHPRPTESEFQGPAFMSWPGSDAPAEAIPKLLAVDCGRDSII